MNRLEAPGTQAPIAGLGPAGASDAALRLATADDAAAIQSIYAHHVLAGCATFELDPPGVDQMRARFAALRADGYPFLVAQAGGQVVGYAYAGPHRARPAYRHTLEDSIYLAPGAAGRGLGIALLRALIDACEQAGFRQMVAVIGDSANAASVAVHRRAGFEMVGTMPAVGWKHGRWVDTVLMQRALGAGDTEPPTR